MTQTPFEQALATVRQLPPRERARLVAVVVEELAMSTPPAPDDNAAWATLERLRREFAQLPRGEGTLADQLERDRAERQAMLEGQGNVHA